MAKCPCGESYTKHPGTYACEDCGVHVEPGVTCIDCGDQLTPDTLGSEWVGEGVVCTTCDELREMTAESYVITMEVDDGNYDAG